MSVLGDFRRADAETLAQIQLDPGNAYDLCIRLPDGLDLDRSWSRLAKLMDMAAFPLNPITTGSLFPDEHHSFGRDLDSRMLTAEEVAEASSYLTRTPFDVLERHLGALLDSEPWMLVPADPLVTPSVLAQVPAEREQVIRNNLAESYEALVAFFHAAASERQCTVFWAA